MTGTRLPQTITKRCMKKATILLAVKCRRLSRGQHVENHCCPEPFNVGRYPDDEPVVAPCVAACNGAIHRAVMQEGHHREDAAERHHAHAERKRGAGGPEWRLRLDVRIQRTTSGSVTCLRACARSDPEAPVRMFKSGLSASRVGTLPLLPCSCGCSFMLHTATAVPFTST